jgi:hypothetical protein
VLDSLADIFGESLYVQVTVLAGPGIVSPITFSPRSELTSTPYALRSLRSDTATFALHAPQGGYVDSARIAGTVPDNTVTSNKILNGTIQRIDVSGVFKAPYTDTADYAKAATTGGNA